MQSVPLSEAKDILSALVDSVESEHEIIEITRRGHAVVVLMMLGGSAIASSLDAFDSRPRSGGGGGGGGAHRAI